MKQNMSQRIHDAVALLKRFRGTSYESAARAYLLSQLEIANRGATR